MVSEMGRSLSIVIWYLCVLLLSPEGQSSRIPVGSYQGKHTAAEHLLGLQSTPIHGVALRSGIPQPTHPQTRRKHLVLPESTITHATDLDSLRTQTAGQESATTQSADPQHTTTPSGDPERTTTQSGDPEHTTTPSGDPEHTTTPSGDPEHTTTPSGDPERTTTPSGDPEHTTTQSGDPEHTTTQSGDPEHTTTQSDDPEHTTTQSGDPEHTTTPSGDPEHTTTQSGDQEHTTTQSGDPEHTTTPSGDPEHTTTQSGDPEHTPTQSGDPERTTTQSGDPERRTTQTGHYKSSTTLGHGTESGTTQANHPESRTMQTGDQYTSTTWLTDREIGTAQSADLESRATYVYSRVSQPDDGEIEATQVPYRTNLCHIDLTTTARPSPCQILTADSDAGLTVNCSLLSLGSSDLSPAWFPLNTTIILLDRNQIQTLPGRIFCHLQELRELILSQNSISRIHKDAFLGLKNLKTLDLQNNYLSVSSYPEGVFEPLVSLKNLFLLNNVRQGQNIKFMSQILATLKSLENLSIDTGATPLYFEDKFTSINSLTDLHISGDATLIANNSFINVRHLTSLEIRDMYSVTSFNQRAFWPLKRLTRLVVASLLINLQEGLHALQPLAENNSTMLEISFTSVGLSLHELYTDVLASNAVLDSNMTKYLRSVCVKSVALIDCNIMIIQTGSLYSEVWNSCLVSIDLSRNPLLGTFTAIAHMLHSLQHLETFVVESVQPKCKYHTESEDHTIFHRQGVTPTVSSDTRLLHRSKRHSPNITKIFDKEVDHADSLVFSSEEASSHIPSSSDRNVQNTPSQIKGGDFLDANTRTDSCIHFYLSPSLKICRMKGLLHDGFMDKNVCLHQAENLKFIDISQCGIRNFRGNITGLTGLETVNLSYNDMSVLQSTVFDGRDSLRELYMSHCQLEPQWISQESARLFVNLGNLELLDISSNSLYSLEEGTFSKNSALRRLNMADNRFKTIPFHLDSTPNLNYLDLRNNLIETLPVEVTHALDMLARRNGDFHLLLDGNSLNCGCGNILFLQWLQETPVHVDNSGNLTCITDEARVSTTAEHADLKALWCHCVGSLALVISIVLFSAILLTFVLFFLIKWNRTLILAHIMRLFQEMRTHKDYRYGVYICYNEEGEDYRFIRYHLEPFIKRKLDLTTFVGHRDREGGGMAWSITNTVNKSWRILLVVTESALTNDWFHFTYNFSMCSQTADNPRRMVIVVEESVAQRLPPELVDGVPEDNIIQVSQWRMTYFLREQLRTRLL